MKALTTKKLQNKFELEDRKALQRLSELQFKKPQVRLIILNLRLSKTKNSIKKHSPSRGVHRIKTCGAHNSVRGP